MCVHGVAHAICLICCLLEHQRVDIFSFNIYMSQVGCGAGNTVFPLLDAFPYLFIHACDFSHNAISLVKVCFPFIGYLAFNTYLTLSVILLVWHFYAKYQIYFNNSRGMLEYHYFLFATNLISRVPHSSKSRYNCYADS